MVRLPGYEISRDRDDDLNKRGVQLLLQSDPHYLDVDACPQADAGKEDSVGQNESLSTILEGSNEDRTSPSSPARQSIAPYLQLEDPELQKVLEDNLL